ncbi:unnamed protein product [Prorocentrum cordatum]|uniref:Uncharacterized protein n=1 Tax=Prorocentrum cordatum TaxID=2364126 RepID=A0ABN9UI17_9DINO|nr:unnamed protein product [Polarella glacialis]|mmetsp:Transcript_113709/g.304987  ORF Transcript_113709/g.304987 Transcript_113709/m.304987 type:complete len:111 (-) Transcript_113709:53-385(-)
MGKMDDRTHSLMMRGGFEYDKKRDRYFMRGEAEWDKEKRIEKGRKQFAVPASSVEEFLKAEEVMVDKILEKAKAKAAKAGASAVADAGDAGDAPPKKKQKVEEEAAEDDE